MQHTAHTYNIMTVNHWQQILYTTAGHPAHWNDKTIILHDDFVWGIHDGQLFDDVEFELHELDESGNKVTDCYCGAWVSS